MFDIECVDQFDFESESFQDLYRRSDTSPFQHPLWLELMQSKLVSKSGMRPVNILVRIPETGQLIAVLPMLKRKFGPLRILKFCNQAVVDQAGPIIDCTHAHALFQWRGLAEAVDQAVGPYDLLWIKHVKETDQRLRPFFGQGVERQVAGFSSYATNLSDNYVQWRSENLSKSRQNTLKRKRNKLFKNGEVEMHTLSDHAEIEDAFQFLRRVRADRFRDREGRDLLQSEDHFDFYLSLAKAGAETGFCRTNVLKLDGETIAATFGLCKDHRYTYLLPGADYERFEALSPGVVMIQLLLEEHCDAGTSVFDFSIGDEPYKKTLGTKPEAVMTLTKGRTWLGKLALTVIGGVKAFQLKRSLAGPAPKAALQS